MESRVDHLRVFSQRIAVCLAVLGSALLLSASSIIDLGPARPSLLWFPDGDHIVISTQFQGMFVVDAVGRSLTTFPKDALRDYEGKSGDNAPALSPDGSRVAYVTQLPGFTFAIETTALDGTGIQRLTVYKDRDGDRIDDNRIVESPVWSPDGSKIAFLSGAERGGAPTYLTTMDADGSNEGVLVPAVKTVSGSIWPLQIWWSPDGNWLAFVAEDKRIVDGNRFRYPHNLHVIRADGTALIKLGKIQQGGIAAWSPDSSLLAFLSPRSDERSERYHILYTVRPDGTDLTEVSDSVPGRSEQDISWLVKTYRYGFGYPPAWSPDGAWLAFAKEDEYGLGVYVARPDGTDLRLVVHGYGGPVSWSSDGTELYIADMAFAIRPDGSGLRSFLAEKSPWPIEELTITTWSPNGSRLAVLTISKDLDFELFTVGRDGTDKRVLVQGATDRIVEGDSGWYDASNHIPACAEGFVVPNPQANPSLVQDCKTLLASRDLLFAEGYANWTSADPIASWSGVRVGCPSHAQVFEGSIFGGIEIGCSTELQVIGLSLSDLAGRIPSQIGDLTSLESLRLSFFDQDYKSRKSRRLPPELGNLANLRVLQIKGDGIAGRIPPEWGNLTNLRELHLHGNELTGAIPQQLGNLANLRELYLGDNRLSGSIPPQLGRLSSLEKLYLNNNGFSGSIPGDLGGLTRLKWLDISSNDLGGALPVEVGRLKGLLYLSLHENGLSGSIPQELGSLNRLIVLYLNDNQFTGSIPPHLGSLTRLVSLSLNGNTLTGPIPKELGGLARLRWLSLEENKLSGSIPPQVGNLKSLSWLNTSDNELTGSIPVDLGNLENLGYLSLAKNNLTGTIPPGLGNLPKLGWLYLNEYELTGAIPPELGNATGLYKVDMSNNDLTGAIPPSLGNLKGLVQLGLDRNNLTGCVPAALSRKSLTLTTDGIPFCS